MLHSIMVESMVDTVNKILPVHGSASLARG